MYRTFYSRDRAIDGGFRFSCTDSEFILHPSCATRPIPKHHFREHSLIYLEAAYGVGGEGKANLRCNPCATRCAVDDYHSLDCDFKLHPDRFHLPQSIKSKHHPDPLTLNEYIVEDDSGENYCDICERRNPDLWVCYCGECELATHVKCAICPVSLKHKFTGKKLRVKSNASFMNLNKPCITCTSKASTCDKLIFFLLTRSCESFQMKRDETGDKTLPL